MKIFLSILFIIVCIALIGIVLFQEGNSQGLGSIAGMGDSYWNKNRGRSLEGTMRKVTALCAALFLVLALVLDILAK